MRLSRSALRPLLAAALTSSVAHDTTRAAVAAPLSLGAEPSTTTRPKVTQRVFLDLRIIERFDVEVLEDAAVRGRLVLGLYGNEAPEGAARFAQFVMGTTGQFAKSGGGPGYGSSSFDKIVPGTVLEGGRIPGLKQTTFAGALEWEYMSRLLPDLRPILEVNDLRHGRRGLLTRARFESGPTFGVTLGPAFQLDGSNEVIGEVVEGMELIEKIETLPFITGRSLEAPGSVADSVFNVQKSIFSGLAKSSGDSRAEDRTGKLLRRVEIVQAGLL